METTDVLLLHFENQYCGPCEEKYQQTLAMERRREEARKNPCLDSCDIPHCKGCEQHFYMEHVCCEGFNR